MVDFTPYEEEGNWGFKDDQLDHGGKCKSHCRVGKIKVEIRHGYLTFSSTGYKDKLGGERRSWAEKEPSSQN